MIPADASDRTCVYRLYCEDWTLLYVGIAKSPDERFRQHAVDKDWWPLVAIRKIEWFGSREAAMAAEMEATLVERPVHNIVIMREDGKIALRPLPDGTPRPTGRPTWQPSREQVKAAAAIKRMEERRVAALEASRLDVAKDIAHLVADGAAVNWLSHALEIDRKTLYAKLDAARAANTTAEEKP